MDNKNAIDTSLIRVRFAPSPTGYLHIGGLRTALFNWLFARHYNGTFLIRVEDTDLERSEQKYTDSILTSLRWTDIESDEPIIFQSQRIEEHKNVIEQLLAQGKAYRCYCSPQEVIARYKAKGVNELFIKYDGYCIELDKQLNKPYAVRFKLPLDQKEVVFDDLIRGRVAFDLNDLEDFIIARSDGRPVYNFVVVVDDAFMNITQIIRGEDHISNTPKQILLYQACGYATPQFAHLALILGPSGDRLSKRDAATSVIEYKQEGYLPDALINYLVRLGWSHGDQEIFTRQELVDYFTLDHVGKKGSIFDMQKLSWVNSVYIKQYSAKELLNYIVDMLDSDFYQFNAWDDKKIVQAIALYQERVSTVRELMAEMHMLYAGPKTFDQKIFNKWVGPETSDYLSKIIDIFEKQEQFSSGIVSESIKQLSKQLGVKLMILAQLIRLALIGNTSGPGVFDMLTVVGKSESLRRLTLLLDSILDEARKNKGRT